MPIRTPNSGEPVYIYSLKGSINDGFLTPFRMKEIGLLATSGSTSTKNITNGKIWYSISWNANYEGEAAYSSAQWNLGENFQFDGEEDLSSFTLSRELVELGGKPIQLKNSKLKLNETLSITNHLRLARIGLRIGAGRTIEYKA